MDELALFAGIGGGLLASRLLGWSTVAAVEIEEYPRRVIMQRQRDGLLDRFPIWDDVRTFDGRHWRGLVDVVSGGFPCQDISVAGTGMGLAGGRSGLWYEYLRIVGEVRPRFVFAENSPMLRRRGLGIIIAGLTDLGYDVRWGVLGAWHVGALHKRDRMWILAHTDSQGEPEDGGAGREIGQRSRDGGQALPDADDSGCQEQRLTVADGSGYTPAQCGRWWQAEPSLGRVVDGFPRRVDQLRGLGNAQVPDVAAVAFQTLSKGLL